MRTRWSYEYLVAARKLAVANNAFARAFPLGPFHKKINEQAANKTFKRSRKWQRTCKHLRLLNGRMK